MTIVFRVEDAMPEYNEGDRINIDRVSLDKEIAKGLHKNTGRPVSALLNHCSMVEGDDDTANAISALMEGANEAVDSTIAGVDSARAAAEGKEYERTAITDDETRAKAKEMNIRNWHNMSIDKLKARIAEVEKGE
jgi:hypothetical protein